MRRGAGGGDVPLGITHPYQSYYTQQPVGYHTYYNQPAAHPQQLSPR